MPRTTSPARRATNHRTRIRPSACSATKIAVRRAHPVRGTWVAGHERRTAPPSSSSPAVVCALSQNSSSSIHRPLRSFLACLVRGRPPRLSPPWHGSALPELEPYLSPVARWSHLVIDRFSEHPNKRVGFKAAYDHILRALFGCSIYIDRATVSLTLPERSLRAPRLRPPPSRRVRRDVDLRTGIESFAVRDSVQGIVTARHGKSSRRAEKFERS